ncbi:MAG: phospho-N-acetylmuramoyl-pentapeptide-transferase [Candidatus Omnitrophica bacterium CG1_02_44_16]|nr:MAG: phospho-N-acetylmuramoyl-pentapeptide-transferase [Candidatus Omnitrophica bacterium CG1_02_44_16]PIY83658.1 MAG: phospho-N-acetylmuramoyl-pentapeptide-transferase [Candidatus Omnitrophica bacterium CG_4_10_14_0_8_um_filter_44_12]PIZ84444.1 MAG: phospho-N-acetylmuramoyl-pentapeptide-transferase [Candidatus Omnitrophica bacterium CG_4_10_14_0_2_um_filter_44_9]
MFYYFLYPLRDIFSGFNIFKYITFRSAMAAITTFFICIIFGSRVIGKLTQLHICENVRKKDEVAGLYDLHQHKQGTPTMGGLLMVSAIIFSTLLWADLSNKYILVSLIAIFWLGLVGFADDYIKLRFKRSKGLSVRAKFLGQIILGLAIGTFLYLDPETSTRLDVPFLKNVAFELGIFYIFFVMFVVVGTSNAVNLTDGLDGLATGCLLMAIFSYGIMSYVSGHLRFSQYLLIPYIDGVGELTVFCAAMMGACLGFLWFNCHPASVFMGDVGSLALGGAIGLVAIFIKKELLLGIVGGIFVIEAFSVILQVGSFKLRKKRIFRMAPLHHHFQMMGWPESKIIVRFWIVAAILALFTLTTLKLR